MRAGDVRKVWERARALIGGVSQLDKKGLAQLELVTLRSSPPSNPPRCLSCAHMITRRPGTSQIKAKDCRSVLFFVYALSVPVSTFRSKTLLLVREASDHEFPRSRGSGISGDGGDDLR